jgi:hypothetical protein
MKITKSQIDAQTNQLTATLGHRKISAMYSIDTYVQHAIDLEEEMSKILSEEIDKQIMFDLRREDAKNRGYTLGGQHTNNSDLLKWMNENTTGNYLVIDSDVWFELERDAVLFTLRWVGNEEE